MRNLILAAGAIALFAAPALADVIRVPRDYATIQAAVNAAATGDKIVIKPGTYPENVQVNAKTDILIRGKGLVTVNPPAGTAIGVVNSSGIRVKGISTVSTGISFGVLFSNSPNGLVAKCRAQGTLGMGALSSGGTRFVACKVNTTNGGLGFGGTGTHTAERCTVTSAATGQAFAVGGDVVNLIRCKVNFTGVPTMSPILSTVAGRLYADRCRIQAPAAGAGVFGFDLQPTLAAAQHELTRNRIEGCNAAIQSLTANNVTCQRNVMAGATGGGIALQGTNLLVDRNTVLLASPSTLGVFLVNATASTVSRNKIKSGGAGVVLLSGSGITVTRNTLKNLAFGVSLTGTGHTCGPKNKYRNCTTPINDSGVGTIILDNP